jgi:hypothetical protein
MSVHPSQSLLFLAKKHCVNENLPVWKCMVQWGSFCHWEESQEWYLIVVVLVLERFHQLWAPSFCQSELGSKKLPFGRNGCSLYRSSCQQRQLHQQPLQIQCYYQESKNLLDRSATNANQGCFAACASMIKKDGRQYCERDNISSEKKKWQLKNR